MKRFLIFLCALLTATIVVAAPSADNMVAAAKGGDVETVKEGLQAGFDPNYKDRQGNSLLIHAAANSNADIVTVLLKGGADPAMQNKSGDDALNYGAIKGNLSIVKPLLKPGRPVNRKQPWQPLSYAIYGKSLDVFNYLMDQGADPNANNPSQASALMIAALEGQEEMAARLLKAGADPTWTKGGESAVDWALKHGNTDIADMVMKAQAQVGFGRSSILAEQPDDEEDAAAEAPREPVAEPKPATSAKAAR